MLRIILKITVLTSVILTMSCGGGGSGSGGGDVSEGLRILHGIISASQLDARDANSKLRTSVSFGEASNYSSFGGKLGIVALSLRSNTGQTVSSHEFNLSDSKRANVLFYGDLSNFGLRSSLIYNEIPELDNQVAIRVLHAVVGAGQVDLQVAGSGISGTDFGKASDYLVIPFTTLANVVVRRTADQRSIQSLPLALENNTAYSVFVSGEIGLFTKIQALKDN